MEKTFPNLLIKKALEMYIAEPVDLLHLRRK